MNKQSVKLWWCIVVVFLLFSLSCSHLQDKVSLTEVTETLEPSLDPDPLPTSTPSPSITSSPTPAPVTTPTPESETGPFSIVWITDTQALAYYDSPLLESLGKGIKNLIDSRNVKAVVHTGDIVDNGYKPWQWDNYDKTHKYYDTLVPFYPVAGNHDMGVKKQSYGAFLRTGLLSHIPEEQKFQGGIIYYSILEEGDTKLLLLCASYDAFREKKALQWLDSIMEQYNDLPCIVITHGYLTPRMSFPGTNWDHVVKHNRYDESNIIARYPNIRLILCGHVNGYITAQHHYDDDHDGVPERTVNGLLINYTDSTYFAYRLLSFDPVSHSITVETFSADPEVPVQKNEAEWGPIDFTIENAF